MHHLIFPVSLIFKSTLNIQNTTPLRYLKDTEENYSFLSLSRNRFDQEHLLSQDMELGKNSKPIQGGGSGSGLEVPFANLVLENERRKDIMNKICTPGRQDGMLGVWRRTLLNRCYAGNERANFNFQNEPGRISSIKTMTGHGNSSMKTGTAGKVVNLSTRREEISKTNTIIKNTEYKVVLGLHRAVEEAINVWCHGDEFSMIIVFQYCSIEFRDTVIANYQNLVWVS